jgi:hypothetical protein
MPEVISISPPKLDLNNGICPYFTGFFFHLLHNFFKTGETAAFNKYNPDFYMRAINISSAEQDVATCFCCDGEKS